MLPRYALRLCVDRAAGFGHVALMPFIPRIENAEADRILIASLPGCDFADAFCTELPIPPPDARPLSAELFASPPPWISALMNTRNAIMRPFGYKAPKIQRGFPVLSESPTEVVSGLNDRHLDFRALFKVEELQPQRSRITLTTAVATHNVTGRLYLTAILPFHKLIVRDLLRRLALRLLAEKAA